MSVPPQDYSETDFENASELVARRQIRRRAPKGASNLVSRLMAHRGIGQQESSNELAQAWEQVVDSRTAARTRVGNLKRGILEIHVDSPMTSQHLTFKKADLLQQLATVLPKAKLRDLRFRIGNIG